MTATGTVNCTCRGQQCENCSMGVKHLCVLGRLAFDESTHDFDRVVNSVTYLYSIISLLGSSRAPQCCSMMLCDLIFRGGGLKSGKRSSQY